MFKKILVPIDLSDPEHYQGAMRFAAQLREMSDGEVCLVTVIPFVPMVAEYIPPEVNKQAVANAESRLMALVTEHGLPTGSTGVSVRHGGVYHEVLEEAQSMDADVIVMGSHSPAMSTYLLGSNAARIVRHAPCSVLVCR